MNSRGVKSCFEIPVLILAGGLGTRLRSAFASGPKSMAPIGGRPFLEFLLRQIRDAGFRHVLLCVGYGRDQIEQWLSDGRKWGLHVRYSVEDEPRGTAGAVKLASGLIHSETFLLLNGDSFFAVDLNKLVQAHLESGALVTMALAKVQNPGRYGTVDLTSSGEISRFCEKKEKAVDTRRWHLVNGGVYAFRKSVLDIVPESGVVSLEREIFPQLLAKGIKGFISDGYFIDIGIPDDFRRAQTELPEHF